MEGLLRRTRKTLWLVSMTAVLGIGGAVWLAGTASAAPGNGHGAIVQHNAYGAGICGVNDTSGTGSGWLVDNCVFNIVTAPNGTVNETVTGRVIGGGNPAPSQAVRLGDSSTGELCDPPGAPYWTGTITPSGNFSAKCSSSPS